MSRRREIPKREIIPDPKYDDIMVAKMINFVMRCGKKSVAERVVYGAFKRIGGEGESGDKKALEMFVKAVDNVKPVVEVKSRRVGGATYQVPVEVRAARQQTLAMRWIIAAANKRPAGSMEEKLAREIQDAVAEKGGAFKRREDTIKMAEANKAFSHYRW